MAKRKTDIDPLELVNLVHNYDLNLATREIYLHSHYSSGHPDEEGGIEYRMATQFVKNLHLLDQIEDKNILVHLQSPGGDWGHGMAMFDAIEHAKSPITMLAYGEISSMSGIVFQAAHRRVMMPNCEFMVHRGFLYLEGVTTTVQSNAVWNKKTDRMMLHLYASRAWNGRFFREREMGEKQVMKFIDNKIKKLGDWNLGAEEAVFYGLADGVFGELGFESLDKIRKA
jgi:ATP-dependent protease ClpP protease subunit